MRSPFSTNVFVCARPFWLAVLLGSGVLPLLPGQSPHPSSATSSAQNLQSTPASAWALDAAQGELAVVDYKSGFVRYRLRTIDRKGDQTRDLIETSDGPVARLILRDGHPLTAEQNDAEQSRLQGMLDDPEAFHKHTHEDGNGKRTAAELIRLLPDAMIFTYAPGQPQRAGVSAPEVVLDYQPNPSWTPPTTISQALTGLQGRLWIDTRTRRMTRLEGMVFRGINVGWGMIAHVNPGGTFMVEQSDLGQGRSLVSRFTEHVSLRALMVKSLHEDADLTASQIQPVESMSYTAAIRRLLDTPLPR